MIPFITCEISLCQYVCELVFGVILFDLDLGVQIDSINNQSRATLWVLETCLTVGLLPFLIILITASLSSNTCNNASWREECTFEETKSTLSRSSIIPWDFIRFESLWGFARTKFVHGSLRSWLVWYVFPWTTATIRYHKSSAGIPSNLNPVSKEMIADSVELCETEVCFLHMQLIGTNVWLPKFVGMTLVCFIRMVLCMFDLTVADGFPRSSLLGPPVLFGTEWTGCTPGGVTNKPPLTDPGGG